MSNRFAAVIVVLLAAVSAMAGDPWKDKAYTQWDEKDVRKILTDSPWAKPVRVATDWKPAAASESLPSGPEAKPESGAGGYDAGRNMGSPGATQSSGSTTPGYQGSSETTFVIRWSSARTVRQALVRSRMLQGNIQEADAKKFLTEEPQEYVVMVFGSDMTPFVKAEDKDLKERAYLSAKNAKEKLSPTRVEIIRDPKTNAVSAVAFHFSKKSAAGEPTLAAESKSVQFVSQVGRTMLKTNFDLQKMSDTQGTDL